MESIFFCIIPKGSKRKIRIQKTATFNGETGFMLSRKESFNHSFYSEDNYDPLMEAKIEDKRKKLLGRVNQTNPVGWKKIEGFTTLK